MERNISPTVSSYALVEVYDNGYKTLVPLQAAVEAGLIPGGDPGTQNLNDTLLEGADAGGITITNLGAPGTSTDASTRGYVDTAVAGKQNASVDLATIAGLSPINDDILQRKAGAWTNRTPAQVKTDMALVKGDVGLGNVDNTSDANKPVSTAQQTALNLKLNLTGGTMSGAIAMGASKITGLAAATTNGDAVRFEQLPAAASESAAGLSENATQAEVNAGTDDARYITPLKLKNLDVTAVALVDSGSIALAGPKHTLATSAATRTFTISHTGDDIVLEVTLSATGSTFTFPATALCVSEGTASGDNTCTLSGVSGDKYIISILKMGSNYYVACKNFGQ